MNIVLFTILVVGAFIVPLWAIGYAIGGVISSLPDEKEKRK